MIGVGVQDKPNRIIEATVQHTLYTAFTAVSNIVFAYCAHVAFFGLIAEMKQPKDFPKSLLMLQIFEISLYTCSAIVIYYYVGKDVASPALSSAGPLLKKIAYGIAIPTVRFKELIGNFFPKEILIAYFRLLLPVSLTAISALSIFIGASSTSPVSFTATAGAQWRPGSVLECAAGFSLGLLLRPSQFSAT